MSEDTPIMPMGFACPQCKRLLRSVDNALFCDECNQTYPIVGGIPDFLSHVNLGLVASRIAKAMDLVAPIYETRFFTSVLLKLSGVPAGLQFIERIANFHRGTLQDIKGTVLDVACGPATYSRRIISPGREVYGIDISMGVLRQGLTYLGREGISGVHLARASVEALPFEDGVLDGVVCSGSLHLFPDKVLSLREIARTMKSGAPLSVQTFVSGKTIFNRLIQRQGWLHTFEAGEVQQYLTVAGFEEFQPVVEGIVLTFSARKAPRHV